MAPPASPLFSRPFRTQRVRHHRFSYQVADGGGVLWFPIGELVGECFGVVLKKYFN